MYCCILIFAHKSIKLQMYKFVIGLEHLFRQCLVHTGIMWCKLLRNERAFLLYFNYMHKQEAYKLNFQGVYSGFNHLSIISLEAGTCMV